VGSGGRDVGAGRDLAHGHSIGEGGADGERADQLRLLAMRRRQIQRKAAGAAQGGAPSESAAGHDAAGVVSQPHDPAEQEADQVADETAESLHGGGAAKGSAAAPAHAAPAAGRKIMRKPAAKEKDDDKAQAAKPKHAAGETGIVSHDVTVSLGGKDTKLPNGTAVSVVQDGGDVLTVQVHSGFGNKEAKIKAADFEKQPGIAVDEDTGKERDDHYETYKGALFGKDDTPKASDPHQGFIGDCYLISAMAAVAARNPTAIKNLFDPKSGDAPSYKVTLYKRAADGKSFEPVTVSVDRKLPTANKDKQNPSYAQEGAGADAPLWPALLEKAYAQFVGGYAKAGEGGSPGNAMEALTGVKQDMTQMPDKADVIEQFKGYEKNGKAVTVSTIGSISKTKVTPFAGKGNALSGKLVGDDGQDVEIAKSSVFLDDFTSKKHQLHAFDDGKGGIAANVLDKGSIDYATGAISLQFKKDEVPENPKNVEVGFDYKGLISKAYNLYANHAYIFEKVQGSTIVFRNPWNMGDKYEPKPIPAEAFVQFFNDISSTTVPHESSCPAKP
jgi:hypothetical protein